MSACVESVFPSLSPANILQPRASTAPFQAKPAANFMGPMPSVVHVSLDSFFASVEQVLNPKLLGKPVLVGRKALASFSAEAGMMGVTSSRALCSRVLAYIAGSILCPSCRIDAGTKIGPDRRIARERGI